MSFAALVEAEARQRAKREAERQRTLRRIAEILGRLAPRYGISDAYMFGSVLRPGRFGPDSDVDLAVAGLGSKYWAFVAELSRALGREVDVVDAATSRFADRIRREGQRWTLKG